MAKCADPDQNASTVYSSSALFQTYLSQFLDVLRQTNVKLIFRVYGNIAKFYFTIFTNKKRGGCGRAMMPGSIQYRGILIRKQ